MCRYRLTRICSEEEQMGKKKKKKQKVRTLPDIVIMLGEISAIVYVTVVELIKWLK